MQRKNRKWLAIGIGLYLVVMVSAFRWSMHQNDPEGNVFNRIEHEGIARLAEQRAKEVGAQPSPTPTGESRLRASAPAYVAVRYDKTHVVFMVATDTEARFSTSPHSQLAGGPIRIASPPKPSAPLAGLEELWEPDSSSLHFFPKIVQQTPPGEQWTLSVSPTTTIPVAIERPVIAPTGCSLGIGFLASIPLASQPAFAASTSDYFVVRRAAVTSADPAVAAKITELAHERLAPALAQQLATQLNERMKQEVSKIDTRLLANAASPGEAAGELPLGTARPRLNEWILVDKGLARGEGQLDYDFRAFLLTPDGMPRLFVRARWKLAGSAVFLMSAWFRADAKADAAKASSSAPASDTKLTLLSADSNWSATMRNGEAASTLGDTLAFQTILNEFDADHDGWAELLVHSSDGDATTIGLYLYTDLGLIPMKAPLRRDTQSPQSCIDP